jgi:phage repressor protein C with HTH and peptisase S24 domain/transcriptional regulator with XRE-family HTH domain
MRKITHDFDTNALIGRVKELRQQHAGDRGKSAFAKALGISPSTYNYYESTRIPPIDILLRIAEVTGADLKWLMTGHRSKKKFAFGQNSEVFEKVDALLTNCPDMNEALLAFIELLSEKKGLESELRTKAGSSPAEQAGWIPVLGQTAAGIVHVWAETIRSKPKQAIIKLSELAQKHTGKTIVASANLTVSVDLQRRSLVQDLKEHNVSLIKVSGQEYEEIVEFVQCKELRNLYPDSFALRIDGDSMSPRINDGDIVILSPSIPAVQGQIAIACIANQIGVTCKLIRTAQEHVHLIPINERYETKIIPKKDLIWALAVLCHITV